MARYVVLSDLHLGQRGGPNAVQRSLLSISNPPAVELTTLARFVAYNAQGPFTLVLTGDVLDLSLAYMRDAVEDLVALVDLLKPTEVVWVIGNHDHHLWMLESELRSVVRATALRGLPEAGSAYVPTGAATWPLDTLQPAFGAVKVSIAYPRYAIDLNDPAPPHQKLRVVFTHGHLLGGIYTAIADALEPKMPGLGIDRLNATVNAPLIEFVWWLIGEAGGQVGVDGLLESLYTELQQGRSGGFRSVLRAALQRWIRGGWVAWLKRTIIEYAVTWQISKLITPTADALTSSADRYAELDETAESVRSWVARERPFDGLNGILVYGHTHRSAHHPVAQGISGINLGSWLVEPGHERPDSTVLMIDDGDGRASPTVVWTRIEGEHAETLLRHAAPPVPPAVVA